MPNKLSDLKVRKTLTEYKPVIAIMNKIAQDQNTTVMEFMRKAIREAICTYTNDSSNSSDVYDILKRFKPELVTNNISPAKVSRYKRLQREYNSLLMELRLETPESMERKNSLISPSAKITIMELDVGHA